MAQPSAALPLIPRLPCLVAGDHLWVAVKQLRAATREYSYLKIENRVAVKLLRAEMAKLFLFLLQHSQEIWGNTVVMSNYIESVTKQFAYYKMLGDKAIAQIPDEGLFWQFNEESNSIAVIVQHLHGNMLSRWTDFLTSDGEKEWRNRDAEFEPEIRNREELMHRWEEGWACLFTALKPLTDQDLETIVYIRNQGHTVQEAINRQLAHYPYHVGQIVYIARMVAGGSWQSLSIPKGKSESYNVERFSEEKSRKHFTDEYLQKGKS
jgi:hypothetical protein